MRTVTITTAHLNECPGLSDEERDQILWTVKDYTVEATGNEFVEVPVAWVNELGNTVIEEWELVAFKKLTEWIKEFDIHILDISEQK